MINDINLKVMKIDALNATRIAVTAIVGAVELGINYFSMHFIGTSLTPTDYGALMVQDMAVMPTVAWFTSKIQASSTGLTETTTKA